MEVVAEEDGAYMGHRDVGTGANGLEQTLKVAYDPADDRVRFLHRGPLDVEWREVVDGGRALHQLGFGGTVRQGRLVIMGKTWVEDDQTWFADDVKLSVQDCPNSGATRFDKLADLSPAGTPAGMLRADITQLS